VKRNKLPIGTLVVVLSLFPLFSQNQANAAVKQICLKGTTSKAVPTNGKCPSGYVKVNVSSPSKKGTSSTGKSVKKPCDATQLFKLKDLRDAILEAMEQIPLWEDSIPDLVNQANEAKIRGDYIGAASANQQIAQAKAEVSAWTKGMSQDRSSFNAIQSTCINNAVSLP